MLNTSGKEAYTNVRKRVGMNSLRLSPFLRIMVDGKIKMNDPLRQKYFEISEATIKAFEQMMRKKRAADVKMIKMGLLLPNTKLQEDEWVECDWFYPLHLYSGIRNVNFIDANDKKSLKKTKTLEKYLESGSEISFFKTYPNCRKINLPKPVNLPELKFENVLMKRRTCRSFSSKAMTIQELSNLLYYSTEQAAKIRLGAEKHSGENPLFLINSLFTPFEVYLVILKVDGLERGIYHYDMKNHLLELIKSGNFTDITYDISRKQYVNKSSVVLLFSAVFTRYMWRYRHSRAYVNLITDLGRFSHLFILTATCLGLKNFLTPAIKETDADNLLSLDGWSEGALYMVAVGK